jgi:hypothetical protein
MLSYMGMVWQAGQTVRGPGLGTPTKIGHLEIKLPQCRYRACGQILRNWESPLAKLEKLPWGRSE